jgi:penicillin-binding protein 1C
MRTEMKIGAGMRRLAAAVVAAIILAVASLAAVWLLLGLWPPPQLVNKSGFSQAIYDRNGRLLRLTLSSDEKYRLWTPLKEIPHVMVDATLLNEDVWFRWHPSVNPASLIRAFVSTYVRRGRRIGGSTITMQLARLRFGIDSRTPWGKLEQILRAFQLERGYSKDQILEAYLNTVPYGGNVEGVGAASIVYFGKPCRSLSLPEALTLAVIPQNPSKRNPLANAEPSEIAQARIRLAQRWRRAYPRRSPRDLIAGLNVTATSRRELPFLAPHLVDRVLASTPDQARITTTIDESLQSLLEQQLKTYVERNRSLGITNGSIILLDHRTMQVLAYVGSAAYFNEAIDGEVNGLRGERSPGSALKPFIYALAIDDGLIHPQTMLKDTALRIAEYDPENFDRDFLGPIDATDALVRSRNVPAIEVANMLPAPGFYGFLKRAGIENLRDESFYGLALALGGVDVTMEEIAAMYAMLANGGVTRPLVMTLDPASPLTDGQRMLSPEASYVVLDMLRKNPRPADDFTSSQTPAAQAIPWKTGTSYGFRDAWALGIVGQYVLGVWIGNFDGTPNPNFVGRDAAGPLFFDIVDALHAQDPLSENVVHGPLNLKRVKVCALSGQLPGPYCTHLKDTWFIPGKSPIGTCQIHRAIMIDAKTGLRACPGSSAPTVPKVYEFWPSDLLKLFRTEGLPRQTPPPFDPGCGAVANGGAAPLISSPARGITYSAEPNGPEIPFTAVTDADSRTVYWFVDSAMVGTSRSGESFFWRAHPGDFLIRAVDDQGRAVAEDLSVTPREAN